VNRADLERLLAAVAAGKVAPDQALAKLAELPYADLGFANLDLHRELRLGMPEAVYAEGKRPADLKRIVDRMLEAHGRVLVTRLAPAAAAELLAELEPQVAAKLPGELEPRTAESRIAELEEPPAAARIAKLEEPQAAVERIGEQGIPAAAAEAAAPGARAAIYHERARILTCGPAPPRSGPPIAVLAAGTSDLPVAEEAAVCAEWFGHEVRRAFDVGVAGLHRLLGRLPEIRGAAVVVAVAGMDGALPTVVASLVPSPVVAVPTSVGYGASFGGLAPLLTMLNGCAPGVGVVNIDNGYGAAVLASRIARLAQRLLPGEAPTAAEPVEALSAEPSPARSKVRER
jgi:pyridinium-3,5-biscarboxylic acid mononucleotide synthase